MKGHAVEIRILGPLEVMSEGSPVELPPSRQARALLAYLAATGRPQSRSALCDLFWKEVVDPRAGLRWALSKLRGATDRGAGSCIVTSKDRVALDTNRVLVDLSWIRSSVKEGSDATPVEVLEQVVAAFRGDFLEDLDLPDCHEYQTWRLGLRESTRRLHLEIRRSLTERLRGNPETALRHALVRLRLDPFSEDAYVAAIEILAELRRMERGQELYEQCRRMLSDDLGRSPSPELLAARRRLRKRGGQGLPPDVPPSSTPSAADGVGTDETARLARALAELPAPEGIPPPGPDEPPLVGRAAELAVLTRLATRTEAEEEPIVALVAGEPGIGKTRLLRELVREVCSAGGWVLSGPIFESEEIRPYGPWIDLIRSLPPEVLDKDLEQDLAGLLISPGTEHPRQGPTERAQLFDAVTRLLERLAEIRAPGLVVLDDVQWLDASSAALLHYAVRTLASAPVAFVLAAREEEIEERSAPTRLLRSLREEGLLRLIPLSRLDVSETASLLQAVYTAADADRIFARSEGNPLFALAMAGSRRDPDRTPATIEEELSDRLDRLDRGARSLLPWAAALGRVFEGHTLLHVVDRPAPEIVEAIDHLERRGVLRPTGVDRYDFTHSLLRRAAYRRISEPGRRAVHRSIARALERPDGHRTVEPATVGHHAELGGLPELAARSYLDAAEHSLWLFALDEAGELVTRGLAQLEEIADDERIPLEMGLLRLYGFRSMRDRRPDDLERRVRRVTDEARRAGSTGMVAVGHAILMELEYQRGAFHDAARSSLRSAEAGRGSDPATAARALAETAACLLLLDQAPEDARRLASEAQSVAEEHGVEMGGLALARALLHHHDGELEAATRAFEEVVILGRRARDRWWECPALTRMIMVELDRSDFTGALVRADEAEALAERLGDETEAAFARGLRAVAAASMPPEAAGDDGAESAGHGEELAAVDDALGELRTLDSLWTIGHVQAYAAEVELDCGRADSAMQRAEEAARAGRMLAQPSLLVLGESLCVRCAAAQGDGEAAVNRLDCLDPARPPRLLSHRGRQALQRARLAVGN